MEDSAILWVSIANYSILRQESVREGFRHDFNKIDTQLRLSHIKKRMPKEWTPNHRKYTHNLFDFVEVSDKIGKNDQKMGIEMVDLSYNIHKISWS